MPVHTPAASATLTLRSPADLLVVIPFLLGFHPRDSVVVVCLEGGPPPMLGLTVRADLPEPEDVGPAARRLVLAVARHRPASVVLAVIGGERGRHGLPQPGLMDRLGEAFAQAGIAVRARTWAPELAAGAPWCCYDPCGCTGSLSDPAGTAVAAAAVVAGQVTYADRSGLERLVAPGDPAVLSRRSALLDAAIDASLDGQLPSGEVARRDLATMRHALAESAAGRLVLDDETVVRLAVALSDSTVRDSCASFALGEQASAAEQLWTALTVATPDPEAAEPATLLAFSALVRGNGALAWAALERAQRAWPGHRLSALLQAALAGGLAPDDIRDWVLAGATRSEAMLLAAGGSAVSSAGDPE